MAELFFGTSSWSEKAWVGVFYPPKTRPADMLPHYASQFRSVEADVTYYRVPTPSMVDAWAERTPEGFVMSAKFPRSIVHGGDGARPNPKVVLRPEVVAEDTGEFLDAMGRLGPKCGPLVLQFPFFNRTVFPGVEPFLERLDGFLASLSRDFRYAVEVRNKDWIGPPLLAVLRHHRVALVLVEIAYMPHPGFLATKHDLLTTDFLYGRLIGDRKEVDAKTNELNRIVVDRSSHLRGWTELLESHLDRVARAYVYANNHYAGYGPATIMELQELLNRGA